MQETLQAGGGNLKHKYTRVTFNWKLDVVLAVGWQCCDMNKCGASVGVSGCNIDWALLAQVKYWPSQGCGHMSVLKAEWEGQAELISYNLPGHIHIAPAPHLFTPSAANNAPHLTSPAGPRHTNQWPP